MTPGSYVALWFPHLKTCWFRLRRPALRDKPFVLAISDHGRKLIAAADPKAEAQGIFAGATVADARAIIPGIEVLDDISGLSDKLLSALAEWCIRFTPVAAVDAPDGLLLDTTGCSHLWGGDQPYLQAILTRLQARGYDVRGAMAGTIGAAWALARFGRQAVIDDPAHQRDELLRLPPAALRLEAATLDKLQKLGLVTIGHFSHMARSALRRRFGPQLLRRLDQAFGHEEEFLQPLQPVGQYEERLPCLEPIATATGISIALQRLLETLTKRLQKEGKGIREAQLKAYRLDGKVEQQKIATNRPSDNAPHLFKLFELKIEAIEPDLGIELFTLEATKLEDLSPVQEQLWAGDQGLEARPIAELLDQITGRFGSGCIRRYLPDEHHPPERSIKPAQDLNEKPAIPWRTDRPRPTILLPQPVPILVTAPVPDYPPLLFRHQGKVHQIKKADGPERIECEWWLREGPHRDYYCVEDQDGARYWLFRSGHYTGDQTKQWFLHGYFP
ncbi:MAG TPA: DNA polymerase Y family protein [Puia sp.]|nr:DNA polymerase Y family protein [Puia sp.]